MAVDPDIAEIFLTTTDQMGKYEKTSEVVKKVYAEEPKPKSFGAIEFVIIFCLATVYTIVSRGTPFDVWNLIRWAGDRIPESEYSQPQSEPVPESTPQQVPYQFEVTPVYRSF